MVTVLPPTWTGARDERPIGRLTKGKPVVYALLDDAEETLYIGVTSDLAARLRHHRGAVSRTRGFASWFAVGYPDRATAEAMEAGAIQAIRPPLNVAGL